MDRIAYDVAILANQMVRMQPLYVAEDMSSEDAHIRRLNFIAHIWELAEVAITVQERELQDGWR